jgi:FixJ family two-component response regulator
MMRTPETLTESWHMLSRTLTGFVAIVDDDSAVRKGLARLLGASAIPVRSFASAREFLESLSLEVPECLIVDLQMPEMTGLELQGELGRLGARIPTIVITAHNERGLRERCLAAGATAYLIKPLDGTQLLASIDSAVA